MSILRRIIVATILTAVAIHDSAGAQAAAQPVNTQPRHSVIELRQYKIVEGQRDAMIERFEENLIDGQEAVGLHVLGQFRDIDDPNRFTWIRGFADMDARAKGLNSFYYGPVWQKHRESVNPLLEDNDNVLLLRPAAMDLALPDRPRADRESGLWVATIHYLWKDPAEGFTEFFRKKMAPLLRDSGLDIEGAYVVETTPNDFPRLPVRQHEKVFVWFARVADPAAHQSAMDRLHANPAWRDVELRLKDYEERAAQQLRLIPTDRSMMR